MTIFESERKFEVCGCGCVDVVVVGGGVAVVVGGCGGDAGGGVGGVWSVVGGVWVW